MLAKVKVLEKTSKTYKEKHLIKNLKRTEQNRYIKSYTYSKLENGAGRITYVGAGYNAMLYRKQICMRFKLAFCIETDWIMNTYYGWKNRGGGAGGTFPSGPH